MPESFPQNPFHVKGPGLTPDRIAYYEEALKKRRERSLRELPNEREKSPEQLRQIRVINRILREECERLGVTEYQALKPEQVHFLAPEEFRKMGAREEGVAGIYNPEEHSIFILDDPARKRRSEWEPDWGYIEDEVLSHEAMELFPSPEREDLDFVETEEAADARYEKQFEWQANEIVRLKELRERMVQTIHLYRMFPTMMHEAIHAMGAQTVSVNGRSIGVKTGYQLDEPPDGNTKQRVYFVTLNEAIVERMNIEFMKKHRKEIEDPDMRISDLIKQNTKEGFADFEILEEENGELKNLLKGGWYTFERKILALILQKIATQKSESVQTVWERFQRGYLTGSLMHLRDIEDAFGPGTLRVLANLQTKLFEKKKDVRSNQTKIVAYFKEQDAERRKQKGEEFLAGRAYELAQLKKRPLPSTRSRLSP